MCVVFTIETIKYRLLEKYGDLISLADGQTFTKMIHPMVFIDKEYGEWTTSPNNVLNKGCTHPQRKLEKRKATNREKYGVDNVFQNDVIKRKRKDTMLSNYGTEHALCNDELKTKAKNTTLSRYGVEYAAQNPVICAKQQVTMLSRYGADRADIVQKTKITNLERYGVANPMQNCEVRNKTAETNIVRYGGVAPACSCTVKEKTKQTNQKVYGGNAPLCSTEVQAKVKQTNIKNYGVDNPFAAEAVKKKIKATLLQNYGVAHPIHNEEIKQRVIKTCLDNFGYPSPLHSPLIRKQAIQTRVTSGSILVLDNGLTLGDYLLHHNRLDLNYTTCRHTLLKHGFEVLKEYVEGDLVFGKTTSLEYHASQVLGFDVYKQTLRMPQNKWRFPDFMLQPNMFLDVDGLFIHSDYRKKDPSYHFNKRLQYESAGYRLLQFRENEVRDMPHIVKSIVENALGRTQKIYARKCKLEMVPWVDAITFLKQNHLQGAGANATAYGLFYQEDCVMLLCVRKKDNGIEISRMCTKAGVTVTGGFSRLLSHAIKKHCPAIIYSWCDLRYANGKGYEKLGFESVRDMQGWAWTDFENVYHRLRCRANMDARNLSEAEHAKELGWVRIYDAGQRLYLLTP